MGIWIMSQHKRSWLPQFDVTGVHSSGNSSHAYCRTRVSLNQSLLWRQPIGNTNFTCATSCLCTNWVPAWLSELSKPCCCRLNASSNSLLSLRCCQLFSIQLWTITIINKLICFLIVCKRYRYIDTSRFLIRICRSRQLSHRFVLGLLEAELN